MLLTYFISLLSITSINGLGFIIVDSFFGWQPVAHVSVRCGLMLFSGLADVVLRQKPLAKALASVSKGWA